MPINSRAIEPNVVENDSCMEKMSVESSRSSINENIYSWSTSFDSNGYMLSYLIQKILNSIVTDSMVVKVNSMDSQKIFDNNTNSVKEESYILDGNKIFILNEKIYYFTFNYRTISVQSNNNIQDFVDLINGKIKSYFPHHKSYLQYESSKETLIPHFRHDVSFDDIIIDKREKEDIIDNTIFHINNIDGDNGIILYGPPGTGKSMLCTAIATEANKNDICTIMISKHLNFDYLQEYLDLFLDKCILIFEDIDTFGESREKIKDTRISDFLQFINGIGKRQTKVVFIATTNYLEYLDDAIRKRPVRFNRLFKVDYPNNTLLDTLFRSFFGEENKHIYSEFCSESNKFTGAHIREIKRTADVLCKKNNCDISEVLYDSINLVKDNFSTTIESRVGF